MLDFLRRMPAPHVADLGVGILEMRRIREEFGRHHGSVMLERHGHREIGDGRAILGQRQQFGHAGVDRLDVIAGIFGEPVEGDMLARVVDFLLYESADLGIELGRCAFAMGLDRFDEERLAAREGGR